MSNLAIIGVSLYLIQFSRAWDILRQFYEMPFDLGRDQKKETMLLLKSNYPDVMIFT